MVMSYCVLGVLILTFIAATMIIIHHLKTIKEIYVQRKNTINSIIQISNYESLLNESSFLMTFSDQIFNNNIRWTADNRKGLIFLKTHKTASTTLNGILWRVFCKTSDGWVLRCFLPPTNKAGKTWNFERFDDWNYIKYKSQSQIDNLSSPFDIWIYHARFHSRIFDIIPTATRMFSIVRHPANRFLSAWTWYELEEKLSMNITEFIHKLSHKNSEKEITALSRSLPYRTGLDATSEELTGYHVNHPKFLDAFAKLVNDVLSGNTVLLVSDRFDESIVILTKLLNNNHNLSNTSCDIYKPQFYGDQPNKRIELDMSQVCISLWEMVYWEQKVHRTKSNVFLDISAISIDDKETLAMVQKFDYILYNISNYMLDRYILDYSAFHSDLAIYHDIQSFVTDRCKKLNPNHNEYITSRENGSNLSPLYRENSSDNKFDPIDVNWESHCQTIMRDNRQAINHAWHIKSHSISHRNPI